MTAQIILCCALIIICSTALSGAHLQREVPANAAGSESDGTPIGNENVFKFSLNGINEHGTGSASQFTKPGSGKNLCAFPTSMWCSSLEIAKACQVAEQCEEYIWNQHDSTAQSVDIALYYESLCPGCHQFILEQLWPVYTSVGSIMNITLVPYGNAQEKRNGSQWGFTCQHGPDECVGNLIQTCAIHTTKLVETYFPFIHCMVKSEDTPEKSGPQCAKSLGINYDLIKNCMAGELGNNLEHNMAVKTGRLQPPHQYVPWVTLFGKHTDEIQEQAQTNLLKLVCDSYKGKKPSGCDGGISAVCVN